MLAEATTTEISKTTEPKTLEENRHVAQRGGRIAGNARKEIEADTGKPVITNKNMVDFPQLITEVIEEPTDLKAAQRWKTIPENIQKQLVDNVYCANCGVTTIVEYSIHNDKFGILLKGKCKKCKEPVARLIEGNE